MRRFVWLFFGVQLGLFALAQLSVIRQHLVLPWTYLLADACASLVTLFDVHAAAQGKVLWNPGNGLGVSIEAGCNGVEAYIILIAGVVAYPATWRQRAWGLVLGFAAVQGLNVLRVVSLFYLVQWSERAFYIFHTYLWQGLIMLDVLVFWLLWIRSGTRGGDDGRMRTLATP